MKTVKLFTLVPLLAVAACSSGNTGQVSFSVTSRSATTAPAASAVFAASAPLAAGATAACGGTSLTDGTNTLCITSVELVLKQVELKRADAAACDAIPDNGDCEEFESGPVLVSLPLGSLVTMATVTVKEVPNGLYNEIEFEIHKVGATEAVALSFPAGISIRVRGVYNANPAFEFTSDLDVSEEVMLTNPLSVSGGQANIDLRVDISSWFKSAGGNLMDPATADPSVVANNIKASFHAFEDDNHDGLDDSK